MPALVTFRLYLALCLDRELFQRIRLSAMTLTHQSTHLWSSACIHLVCHMHDACDLLSFERQCVIPQRSYTSCTRISTNSPRNVLLSCDQTGLWPSLFSHQQKWMPIPPLLSRASQCLQSFPPLEDIGETHMYEWWRSITKANKYYKYRVYSLASCILKQKSKHIISQTSKGHSI